MKKLIPAVLSLFIFSNVFAQNAAEIITGVLKSQKEIKNISYNVARHDTGINKVIRTFKGNIKIETNTADVTFGYKFWAKTEGTDSEFIYDGNKCYDLNVNDKTYQLITKPAEYYWGISGGRLLLTDLIKLDTLDAYTPDAIQVKATQDADYYYLTIYYADIKKYDVIKRTKWLKIDKKIMLPVAVRSHQEQIGRVQDIYYEAANVVINSPVNNYDFSPDKFLQGYQQKVNARLSNPVVSLKGKPAPGFELVSFDEVTVASAKLQGKVVLLDFWEVWCGPCVEAMPKVDALYEQYKGKGLSVYGITNDIKQLDAARLLVKKIKTAFPVLIGNEQLKKDYQLRSIPLYILIDKTGKIIFTSEGYSNELELAIKTALI